MIKITKPPGSIPSVLQKSTERERVIAHYKEGAKGKKVDYKDYRHKTVKELLEDIFHGKCGYCESKIVHVTPSDIEHYRPKNKVLTQNGEQTGYYWLGADWDNLILSCPSCNRSQIVKMENGVKKRSGKAIQFPLSNENFRCKSESDAEAQEDPYRLLLHPCIDPAENHLEYLENGIIRPKELSPGNESPQGKETINVVGLSRYSLIKERERHFKTLRNNITFLKSRKKEYAELMAQPNPDPQKVQRCEEEIQLLTEALTEALDAESPYLGMTRQFVIPVLDLYNIPHD